MPSAKSPVCVNAAGTPARRSAAMYAFAVGHRFASYVTYLPREDVTVIAFSNIYSSATTDIGNDIAAIAIGIPYAPTAMSGRFSSLAPVRPFRM